VIRKTIIIYVNIIDQDDINHGEIYN